MHDGGHALEFDANQTAMDILCPMHLKLDATGHICHVGPTLEKLRPDMLLGRRFLEVFELQRPRQINSMAELKDKQGQTLHLRFRTAPTTRLKGVLAIGPDTSIVNLSFGIAVTEAVATYNMSNGDFAATDLTVEMLYLAEAKLAALDESRKLIQRLQGAKIAAEEQAFTDTLTGLKNRRAMDHILARKAGVGEDFSCMKLDLDFFKSINDTLGHAAGDHVLQIVAKILVDETRSEDTVSRVGGDEFVIVLNRLNDTDQLEVIARRIIDRLEQPIPFGGDVCRISGSAGTTLSSTYTWPKPDEILHHADLALYASKKAGRGRHTLFSKDLLEIDLTVALFGERGAAHPDVVARRDE